MTDAPGRITLWGIEVFVAAAEERSISAAARRLGSSPSSVSQQLTNLEKAVGTALLNRNERPVTLTPAGEVLRRRAEVILNEAAQARAELAMSDPSRVSRIRLGVIEDFEADVTPALLARLAGAREGASVLLETGASHVLYDQLEAHALDAIVAAEMGDPADWMEVHPVLTERFVVALPRGAARDGDVAALLREMPMVQYSARHLMGRRIEAHLSRHGLRPAPQFALDSYHTMLALVAQGAGWAIVNPLGLLRARRFLDAVEVAALPLAPLERSIAVIARRDGLGKVPAEIADDLSALVSERALPGWAAIGPDLADHLRIGGARPAQVP